MTDTIPTYRPAPYRWPSRPRLGHHKFIVTAAWINSILNQIKRENDAIPRRRAMTSAYRNRHVRNRRRR
jgi:hypothetical protein